MSVCLKFVVVHFEFEIIFSQWCFRQARKSDLLARPAPPPPPLLDCKMLCHKLMGKLVGFPVLAVIDWFLNPAGKVVQQLLKIHWFLQHLKKNIQG